MKNINKDLIFKLFAVVVILVILYYIFVNFYMKMIEKFGNDSDYKWISDGTCASHNLQDLTQSDCSSYLQDSNYTVTGADHGPPGCWLVFGKSLTGAVQGNPQLSGKGFGCYSENKTDGKQCSSDFPCICK